MSVKIAINGFGRIGRNAFKIAFDRQDTEIVAINDLTDNKTLAHLLKYDSNYGTYSPDVSADEQGIIVDGKVFTVEGNSSGRCRQKRYSLGDPVIFGYARING